MNPVSNGLLKGLRRVLEQQRKSFDICRQSRVWSSTVSFSDLDEKEDMEYDNEHTDSKRELEPQGVDPKKGWGFRGVHRAVICGKVGQVPLQKILRSGRTITSFTVGTGGMFDQRVVGPDDLPKPAQWHRIVVHNDHLGAYAIQKLVKNAAVYVEGDIETRVYNDSIDDQVRSIPEICVRRDALRQLTSKGQTQCWKLPHKVGSGEGLYEASLTPAMCNASRLRRTQDLLAQGRFDCLNLGTVLLIYHLMS